MDYVYHPWELPRSAFLLWLRTMVLRLGSCFFGQNSKMFLLLLSETLFNLGFLNFLGINKFVNFLGFLKFSIEFRIQFHSKTRWVQWINPWFDPWFIILPHSQSHLQFQNISQVFIVYFGCITLYWSSHRKIKGSKKPRKLLKFGILNELGTEISIRVSLGSRTVLYSMFYLMQK